MHERFEGMTAQPGTALEPPSNRPVDSGRERAIFASVKRLLAFVFGIALILSQAALLTGAGDLGNAQVSTPKCCGHCQHCDGRCCMSRNNPDSSRSIPAVPSRGVSQNEWQVLAAVIVARFPPQTAPEPRPFSSLSVSCRSVASPLYQRDCSYII